MLNKIFPYVCIIFFSCVEHTFYFKVLPTGSYQVRYNAHGDKGDLTDNDFPLPTGEEWIINSSMDLIDAESYDYSANRVFMSNEFFPITFFKGDTIYFKSLLKHPLHISHSNWIFWETYEFDGLFQGRSVQSKYPAVGQLVISPDAPPKGWASEALEYLLTETLDRTDLDWNIRPIIENELNHWITNDLQSVSDSILIEDIDYYKEKGLDIIMQPAPPVMYNAMDSIFKVLEDELRITLDLIDDSFSIQIILPGIMEFTNAESQNGDTLIWSFELIDYMNEDYIFKAKSSINYPIRQQAAAILLLIIVLLFIGLQLRQRGTNHI